MIDIELCEKKLYNKHEQWSIRWIAWGMVNCWFYSSVFFNPPFLSKLSSDESDIDTHKYLVKRLFFLSHIVLSLNLCIWLTSFVRLFIIFVYFDHSYSLISLYQHVLRSVTKRSQIIEYLLSLPFMRSLSNFLLTFKTHPNPLVIPHI